MAGGGGGGNIRIVLGRLLTTLQQICRNVHTASGLTPPSTPQPWSGHLGNTATPHFYTTYSTVKYWQNRFAHLDFAAPLAGIIYILPGLLSGFANDNDSVWAEGELQKYDVG